jgi:DMSO/TMAO reductase YedYZ molybdopterin-dependent catalytic subunit
VLGLIAIRQLPRLEMIAEFKCIEGWSVVVRWAGARFTDFMRAYPPQTRSGDPFSLDHPEDLPPYVRMATPDGEYYVGLDMESMLHPQTLLCYERNGAPLSQEHGAPLRLVIPVKYGVKNIKRIGTIRYSTLRPADYWAERGYDWYVGL